MNIEARMGDFEGNIMDLLAHYSPGFEPLYFSGIDDPQYVLDKIDPTGEYSLMISDREDLRSDFGYSILATVMGPVRAKAKELMDDFERNIPIELVPVPDNLQKSLDDTMRALFSDTGSN